MKNYLGSLWQQTFDPCNIELATVADDFTGAVVYVHSDDKNKVNNLHISYLIRIFFYKSSLF